MPGLSGCSSTYVGGYDYSPRPVDREVGQSGRMLLTVVGLREAEKDVRGRAIEVQVQLENEGDVPLRLLPSGLALTSANLVTLRRPATEPAEGLTVEAGQTGRLTAYFELPQDEKAEQPDLDGLSLRASVLRDGEPLTNTVTFTKNSRENRGRSGIGFGVGVGVGL